MRIKLEKLIHVDETLWIQLVSESTKLVKSKTIHFTVLQPRTLNELFSDCTE
jgi:hypothetical protein